MPATGNALTMHLEKDTVLEDLITYSDLVSTPRLMSKHLFPATLLTLAAALLGSLAPRVQRLHCVGCPCAYYDSGAQG